MQPTAQAVGKSRNEPAPAGAKDLLSRRIVILIEASHPRREWEAEWRDLLFPARYSKAENLGEGWRGTPLSQGSRWDP
jgi:hypothetical protein